eukprot:CAMPEP_0174370430 /NCGR_PEP_ID=MMETSP0811_2-20130205/96097_1 /TAXON_ID=73025 ORGANISM="Eutreptiella gymnastica-like, Strain CCMP1594" /NCGR_SAMPLE_ID=MMETSP0811_2 /ASSEMBLY_ACC=CAM_ASM_000667 /LENGTH=139 /DNA_ID=CAMNT_0015515839 /DNA_START=395 /DNA_END=812 /DNA_ORIENTATION=+
MRAQVAVVRIVLRRRYSSASVDPFCRQLSSLNEFLSNRFARGPASSWAYRPLPLFPSLCAPPWAPQVFEKHDLHRHKRRGMHFALLTASRRSPPFWALGPVLSLRAGAQAVQPRLVPNGTELAQVPGTRSGCACGGLRF